ncbi:uncharacterized protein LOC144747118 [Ciona intestinalis]
MGSNLGYYSWSWRSVSASTVAHYICQITAILEYYKGSYFIFVAQVVNHADAKSTCVELGGHLAIIPDAETQTFIQTKGDAYKSEGKWMITNNNAWIDAVKTSDGTGWEWSTTHDKFYFKTTQRGKSGPFMVNGKYNNWHIYNPNHKGDHAVTSSYPDANVWRWRTAYASSKAQYICQVKVKLEYHNGNLFHFSPQTANHAGAKLACVELGGHLAIIPDAETQAFIQTKGAAYKKAAKWMITNNHAYIDAVKTSDGTGWEWSTTHDKFYFKTTQRGYGEKYFYFKPQLPIPKANTSTILITGPHIINGKYNNWHIYRPNYIGNYAVIGSELGHFSWSWQSVSASTVAYYICQIAVKSTKLFASKSTLNVKYGEDFVLCSSNTNLGPLVSWRINLQDVSTNTSERVYQIITQPTLDGISTSRLYLTRGLHQNSGVYTCNATSLDQSAATTVTSMFNYLY